MNVSVFVSILQVSTEVITHGYQCDFTDADVFKNGFWTAGLTDSILSILEPFMVLYYATYALFRGSIIEATEHSYHGCTGVGLHQ